MVPTASLRMSRAALLAALLLVALLGIVAAPSMADHDGTPTEGAASFVDGVPIGPSFVPPLRDEDEMEDLATVRPGSRVLEILGAPSVGPDGAVRVKVTSMLPGTLTASVAARDDPATPLGTAQQQLDGATGGGRTRDRRRGGGTTVSIPLTRAGAQRLRRSGRLPVVVTLSLAAAQLAPPDVETATITLVSQPAFSRSAGGVRRPGGYGVERIRGSRGGDVLGGQSGNDRLFGLGGNDRLAGGTGNDTLFGNDGDDSLDGNDGDDRLHGGPGNDIIIESRFGDDRIDGGPGDDWIVGGRGVDRIAGGPGDDVIYGGSAPDTVNCGPGDDVVFVNLQSERSRLTGCEEVRDEEDIVSRPCDEGGTDQPETLLGTDGDDVCRAGGGNDDVEGAGGDDELHGGDGDDRMFGRFGNDRMFGGAGNDELEGGRGADLLDGGSGSDRLNGGYGNDVVRGGAGNDSIVARSGGRDRIDCGPGKDTAVGDRGDTFTGCETVKRG